MVLLTLDQSSTVFDMFQLCWFWIDVATSGDIPRHTDGMHRVPHIYYAWISPEVATSIQNQHSWNSRRLHNCGLRLRGPLVHEETHPDVSHLLRTVIKLIKLINWTSVNCFLWQAVPSVDNSLTKKVPPDVCPTMRLDKLIKVWPWVCE